MPKKIRLLIVDDEERFLKTVSERLTIRDFDVTPVTGGAEALEAARKQEFDIALVDLKMPGLSGEEVLLALKKEHPLMEIIMLTGHGSIDSAVQCTQAGSYRYLQKPYEMTGLLEVLRDAYQARVQNRLQLQQAKIEELTKMAMGESPLGILRRLRELDS
ncbi:MAG: response regulator [Proteobacteria bacterium]|nr:response regulator [Pseudomonadota bacterium]